MHGFHFRGWALSSIRNPSAIFIMLIVEEFFSVLFYSTQTGLMKSAHRMYRHPHPHLGVHDPILPVTVGLSESKVPDMALAQKPQQ